MKECSKSISRRLANANFLTRYFVGHGLDIGGKPDPLALYVELFPRAKAIRTWDLEDGDAQFLEGIADQSYDFVHSSHCLEHLINPTEGMHNWFRVLKPGGHLIVTVPDEDLYEQGTFPSTFNKDHKWTFTIFKHDSWSGSSINLIDLVNALGSAAEIVKVELLDSTYRYRLPRFDQTLTPVGECGIEIILRKRTAEEVDYGGRKPSIGSATREVRIHLNQYRDDISALKSLNERKPPFQNDNDI